MPTPDRRSTPATARVALTRLRGLIDRPAWTEGEPARIATPLTDLCRAPNGARDRQLLRGAEVLVIDRDDGWAFVEAQANLYCGWIALAALTKQHPPLTHRVTAPATHIYLAADMKQREVAALSMGACLTVTGTENSFAQLAEGGFVPLQHLTDRPDTDAATVAQRLLGTPYLWGGNSRAGIDCSGLVHAALSACAIPCPGDADQQCAAVGRPLDPAEPYARGDLLFWRGHVAMAISPEDMIHANARAMAVTEEAIIPARERIEATDPYLGARRPTG